MKRLSLAVLFFALNGLLTHASADNNPLRSFYRPSVKAAKNLEHSLSGTSWVYHWNGEDYPLRFGADGKIEKLQWWPGVCWRIIGPSEVLLEQPDGRLMLLRFNDATTSFQCIDWSGSSASGTPDVER